MTTEDPRPSRPLPVYSGPYQPGISDPQWPAQTPDYLTDPKQKERYVDDQAGRPDAQDWFIAIYADVNVTTKTELRDLIKDLSAFARREMLAAPRKSDMELWTPAPATRRVTITLGFGHSVFMSKYGDDRFDLRHRKPKWLAPMQAADVIDQFDPSQHASDLIIIVASDAQQVNDRMLMLIRDGMWRDEEKCDRRLRLRNALSGYQRLDYREHLRIADGRNNLSNYPNGDLDRLVFVKDEDFEPAWCVGGSYLMWKKIELDRALFLSFSKQKQSAIIGRDVENGAELSGGHIKKVQPRRNIVDFMGIHDLDRRLLRRGYIYVGEGEHVATGRLFFSYMRSLEAQADWAVQLWQCNPDFPEAKYGHDPLFTSGVAKGLAGGYYFCPPNSRGEGDFVGSGLFD